MFSTASEGFMNACLAAKAWKKTNESVDNYVGYCTTQSNIAVERAISFSNIEVWKIPKEKKGLADEYPMSVTYLEKCIQEDIEAGKIPTIFIATVGTTATLTID